MKAFELSSGFGIENLRLVEREVPIPSETQIVMKVRAVSLNYRDLLVATGLYNPNLQLPLVLCSDGAGEVAAVGSQVTRWKVGDKVASTFFQGWIEGDPTDEKCSTALGGGNRSSGIAGNRSTGGNSAAGSNDGMVPGAGMLTQYVALDQQGVISVPEGLSLEEAACLPCAALTAWAALTSDHKLKPGQTVLVQGSGGVSIFALQLAKAMGLEVIATSSSDEKLARLKQLGAGHGINYQSIKEWGKEVRKLSGGMGVDHVVEVGGAGTLMQSLDAVKRGGHISLIGVLSGAGAVDPIKILMKGVRVQGIYVGSRAMFEDMNKAIERDKIKPVIDKVFKFEDAVQALQHMQSGNHFGKIVVSVQ